MKFSTYATWWIRQAITRALADKGRTVRLPAHMVTTLHRLITVNRALVQTLGREPTAAEIGEQVDMSAERVVEILAYGKDPFSLQSPIGEDEDVTLQDFVEDQATPTPHAIVSQHLLVDAIAKVLEDLDSRDRRILELRFGLADGRSWTLAEVGKLLGITRERVRQIEERTIKSLRHPAIRSQLSDFLE